MEIAACHQRVEELLRSGSIQADARTLNVVPTEADLRETLLPLLDWCRSRRRAAGRGVVGIAAPPASGKTLVTAWLAATARACGCDEFAFASLDGYHLPNVALDARKGTDPEGHAVPLRKLKGAPITFDAERLLADLRRVRASRESVRLPVYSRELHDPIPDAVEIGPAVEWVFLEGNYLFLDAPIWRDICALLDRRIFIDAPEDLLRRRLTERHGRAGRDAGWIESHYRRTDGPNIRLVRGTAKEADVVLTWGEDGRLRSAE